MGGELRGQKGCELGVQRRQDVVSQLDEVDLEASRRERLDSLEADEPCADDDGARGLAAMASRSQELLDALPQCVDVRHGAKSVHCRVVQTLDGRTHAHGAGGEQQCVIRQ